MEQDFAPGRKDVLHEPDRPGLPFRDQGEVEHVARSECGPTVPDLLRDDLGGGLDQDIAAADPFRHHRGRGQRTGNDKVDLALRKKELQEVPLLDIIRGQGRSDRAQPG